MLPYLHFESATTQAVRSYLKALVRAGFSGDQQADPSTRTVMATDNSVYQVMPQAILFPRSLQDLQKIFTVASAPEFQALTFTPRGGGTGTTGQSLTEGILIDCSRSMTAIKSLDLERERVVVEPGVVLDELNRYLAPHGYFFPISISTGSRATLGGMASTNACGKGSTYYGRMSDQVLATQSVLCDGRVLQSQKVTLDALSSQAGDAAETVLYRSIVDAMLQQHETIQSFYPTLSRTVTGYTLAEALDLSAGTFDLNALLVGSEGTLSVFSELTLKIRKVYTHKLLLVLQYADFASALHEGEKLIEFHPEAIETMDDKIIANARLDILFPEVEPYLANPLAAVKAITLVEFVAYSEADLARVAMDCLQQLRDQVVPGRLSYRVLRDARDIKALWELRKKSVGLLSRFDFKGRRPAAGIEDTLVPPQKLSGYIQALCALLDRHGLVYGLFGHVDAGCVHVRPALDLTNPRDELLYYQLVQEVEALVKRYGGVLWGEHGKGFRSQFVPDVFGETLFSVLCTIKRAFDPLNRLNPGKVAVPSGRGDDLVKMNQVPLRGKWNRDIPSTLKAEFQSAMACDGNGACFESDVHEIICPSYKVTQDRVHSPKGRANLAREWLRLKSVARPPKRRWPMQRYFLKGLCQKDYSHEVYKAMQGCLGCRACQTQCPVQVNVPSFKANFLASYHSRYARSLGDFLMARSEKIARGQSRFPRIANFLGYNALSRFLVKHLLSFESLPRLSVPSVARQLSLAGIPMMQANDFLQKDEELPLVIVQDFVTSFYEAELVVDCCQLLRKLGKKVAVLPWFENGKAWQVKGYVDQFKKRAEQNVAFLQKVSSRAAALIGLDPSITLTYRQEYVEQGVGHALPPIHLLEEYLVNLECLFQPLKPQEKEMVLLMHCTEKAASSLNAQHWVAVFAQFGLTLTVEDVGCCGMAGSYGLERAHQRSSKQLFSMSWLSAMQKDRTVLATGYSCRAQIRRLTGQVVKHPVSFLLDAVTI